MKKEKAILFIELKLLRWFQILLMTIPTITAYLADIFAHDCVREHWYIFPWKNQPPKNPYVLISMCHAMPRKDLILNQNNTVNVKPIARFSYYSFFLDIVNIRDETEAAIWHKIYEGLIITSIQEAHFEEKAERYKNDYPLYNREEFKLEFLRSRWNIDRISLYQSHVFYSKFVFQDHHLPISLEKNPKNSLEDIKKHEIYMRIIGGRGHKCRHKHMRKKLASLTKNFNAYDRIFCDAFDYHNLSLTGYWNPDDMIYHRWHMLRDEILSSFPTESVSLFYASPMITFVVLEREPVPWMFIFRPFPKSLWVFIVTTVCTLAASFKFVDWKIFRHKSLLLIKTRYKNTMEFLVGVYKTVIISAYSGMVLYSILYPLHAWTPSTFQELNATKDYVICTSSHAPIKIPHMTENYKLNGIMVGNWQERKQEVPAHYFESWVKAGESQPSATRNETKDRFIAVLMYDDKMNLWLKGREFIQNTYEIFNQIKPASDKVLSELRYVSVPSGATRLHFLVETMKRGFTSGVWIRYYNLEMNYYKNVAPILVRKIKLKEKRKKVKSKIIVENKSNEDKRPLTLSDLYSCFILLGMCLSFAGLIHVLQNCCK